MHTLHIMMLQSITKCVYDGGVPYGPGVYEAIPSRFVYMYSVMAT